MGQDSSGGRTNAGERPDAPGSLSPSPAASARDDRVCELAATAWIYKPSSPLPPNAPGVLNGKRFAVKDNIDVAGWPTTAACTAFEYRPATHAKLVHRLLDAGACLEGKTNLDQFACGLSGTRSPWGAVPNAFDSHYVSGGSSSGSAYVVATGQVDFAIGTDTAGSGRVPAGLNNIVGLKPSKGLISTAGVVPAARTVDCVSIFARTVDTAFEVLEELIDHDPLDPYSRALRLQDRTLGSAFRFGIPAQPEWYGDPLSAQAFADAIEQLRALGGTPIALDFTVFSQAAALLYESAMVAERHEAIRAFFDTHESDVIEPVRAIIAGARRYSATDLYEAQHALAQLARRAAQVWRDVELLVVPTTPTHYRLEAMQARPVELNRNLGTYTNFVNLLDYAAISVPSAIRPDGLPFGITFIAPAGGDLTLARLAQRYHLARGLTLGATGARHNEGKPLHSRHCEPAVRVAVVGAHLSGMPLNGQLTERGATLIGAARTAPDYSLFALRNSTPPKPGLLRVEPGRGHAIELEIWEMPVSQYGSFVALIPPPLGIGTLQLADGGTAQGFVCEPWALQDARDISEFGGWRAFIAAQQR